MSSVPCSSSIRFLYWSFSFTDVDTLLPLDVDCLPRFVQRSDQPCPLSRFKSTSVLRTKIGDSALALNRRVTHRDTFASILDVFASCGRITAQPSSIRKLLFSTQGYVDRGRDAYYYAPPAQSRTGEQLS